MALAMTASCHEPEVAGKAQAAAARLDGQKIVDPNWEFASVEGLEGKVLLLGRKTFRRLRI